MTLHLTVKPGSKVDKFFYDAAGKLNVKAPAQDGRANSYLIEFLAKDLGIAKSNVTIVAGFTIRINGLRLIYQKWILPDFGNGFWDSQSPEIPGILQIRFRVRFEFFPEEFHN